MEGLDGAGGGLTPLAGTADGDAAGGGGEDFLLAGIDGELEGLEGEICGGGGDFCRDRFLTVAAR